MYCVVNTQNKKNLNDTFNVTGKKCKRLHWEHERFSELRGNVRDRSL